MPRRAAPPPTSQGALVGGLILLVVVAFIGGRCSSGPSPSSTESLVGQAGPQSSPGTPIRTARVRRASANCRAAPQPAAAILASIHSGNDLQVFETSGTWSRVQWLSQTCWISTSLLTSGGAPPSDLAAPFSPDAQPSYAYSPSPPPARRSSGASSRHRSRSSGSTSTRRSYGGDFGSSCPCSSSRICIGPRGGRYCITSGGNKRYGV
jgi:hypothetical protein